MTGTEEIILYFGIAILLVLLVGYVVAKGGYINIGWEDGKLNITGKGKQDQEKASVSVLEDADLEDFEADKVIGKKTETTTNGEKPQDVDVFRGAKVKRGKFKEIIGQESRRRHEDEGQE